MNTYPTFIAAFVDQIISTPVLAAVLAVMIIMIVAFNLPRIRDFKKDTGHEGSGRPLPQISAILGLVAGFLVAMTGARAYTDTHPPTPRTLSAAWGVIELDGSPELLLSAIGAETRDGERPLSEYRLYSAIEAVSDLRTIARAERAASFLELEQPPAEKRADAGNDPAVSVSVREQLLTLLGCQPGQPGSEACSLAER